jgi:hypothetical protein
MSPLLAASELDALRDLVESGMETDVTIRRHTTVEGEFGDVDTFVEVERAKGWLREITTASANIDKVGGVIAVAETHRLFVPVGTDIQSGDVVLANGEHFRVQHTDASSTYLTHITAMLRRGD